MLTPKAWRTLMDPRAWPTNHLPFATMKRKDIEALQNLPENVRADLFTLLESVETKDREIADMRKKAEDSDKVVAKNADLERLVATRDQEKAGLQARLDALLTRPQGTTTWAELSAFRPFFDIFPEGNDDETEDSNP